MKDILLNYTESELSLTVKFGQFIYNITKEKYLTKMFTKNMGWELVPNSF